MNKLPIICAKIGSSLQSKSDSMNWAQRTDPHSKKDNVMVVSSITLRESLPPPPPTIKKAVTPAKKPLPRLYVPNPEPEPIKDLFESLPFHNKVKGYGCSGCGSSDHLLYQCPTIHGIEVREVIKKQKKKKLTYAQRYDRMINRYSSSSDEDEVKDCKVCGKGNHWTHKCSIWLEQEAEKAKEEKLRMERLAVEDKKWMDKNLPDVQRGLLNAAQIATFIKSLADGTEVSLVSSGGVPYKFTVSKFFESLTIYPRDDRLRRVIGGKDLVGFIQFIKSKDFVSMSSTVKPRITLKEITEELHTRGVLTYCCGDSKERYHEYRFKGVTYVVAISGYFDSGNREYSANVSLSGIISLYNKYSKNKVSETDLQPQTRQLAIKSITEGG